MSQAAAAKDARASNGNHRNNTNSINANGTSNNAHHGNKGPNGHSDLTKSDSKSELTRSDSKSELSKSELTKSDSKTDLTRSDKHESAKSQNKSSPQPLTLTNGQHSPSSHSPSSSLSSSPASSSGTSSPSGSPSKSPPLSRSNSLKQQQEEEESIFTQIGSFFKNLIFSEPRPSPQALVRTSDDWQANYLSPVHTKLKKEGKIPTPEKEKDVEWLLKNHFKGILPYYRVWEIKMEEMDQDPICIGRGTPPFPNRPIFQREMVATKLFLKDYGKRRGLTNQNKNINEEEVEVKTLKKTASNERKHSFSTSLRVQSQSLAPDQVIKRRKNVNSSHRVSSKLIS